MSYHPTGITVEIVGTESSTRVGRVTTTACVVLFWKKKEKTSLFVLVQTVKNGEKTKSMKPAQYLNQ
jgi:hypothetical protein